MIVFGMNLHPNSSCIPKLWLFQTLFPPRLSSMRASPSTRQPPTWLEHWRTFLLHLFLLEFNVIKSMRKLVRLGIRPRTWLKQHGFARAAGEASCTDAEDHGVTEGLHSPRVPAIRQPPTAASPSARDAIKGSSGTKSSELGRYTSPTSSSSSALPLPSQDTILSPSELVHRTTAAKSKSKAAKSKSNPAPRRPSDTRSTTSSGSKRPMIHDLTMNDYQGSGYTREEFREHHGMLRGKGADLRQSGSVSLRSGELGLEAHDGQMTTTIGKRARNKLTRHRNMPRLLLYNLHHQDCPIPKHLLWSECRAEVQYEDGTFETVQYDWRSHQETQLKMPWTGRTVFTIQNSNNQSTGHRPSIISRSKGSSRQAERAAQRVYKIEYDLVSQSKDDDHLLEHLKKSRDTRSKVDILETFAGQANICQKKRPFWP